MLGGGIDQSFDYLKTEADMKSALFSIVVFGILGIIHPVYSQPASYAVILDNGQNGAVRLDPALPADGRYPAGTEGT
jgi:hypothetical protein